MASKKYKYKKIHHDGHKLDKIRSKIESHGYDRLTDVEIEFLSSEIESGKLDKLEVEQWMKQR